MAWINTLIGLLVGIIVIIPVFYVTKKWQKITLAIVAVIAVLGVSELSKNYFYPYVLGWQFERQIREVPLFASIAKQHPDEFATFIKQVKQGILEKQSEGVLAGYSSQLMDRIFYQHLQAAPNELVMQYLGAILELYRFLYNKDPRAVLRMEYGQASAEDLNAVWNDVQFKRLLEQLLDVKKKIIASESTKPLSKIAETEAASVFQSHLQEMEQQYGAQMVREIFNRKQGAYPPNIMAPVLMDFYARMGAKGPEKAGIMMRYIASLKIKGIEKEAARQKEKN
ncbi:MAG: hypothetical protein AB7I18_03830 [Candidatus Berkiella sp.]